MTTKCSTVCSCGASGSSSGTTLSSTKTTLSSRVVDDVGDLLGEQADVQRVQHRADAGHGEIQLEVALVVPGERADAVARLDAQRRAARARGDRRAVTTSRERRRCTRSVLRRASRPGTPWCATAAAAGCGSASAGSRSASAPRASVRPLPRAVSERSPFMVATVIRWRVAGARRRAPRSSRTSAPERRRKLVESEEARLGDLDRIRAQPRVLGSSACRRRDDVRRRASSNSNVPSGRNSARWTPSSSCISRRAAASGRLAAVQPAAGQLPDLTRAVRVADEQDVRRRRASTHLQP